MIELETQRLGDHEILHAFPAGKGQQPLPVVVFIMALLHLSWFTATLQSRWHRRVFAW